MKKILFLTTTLFCFTAGADIATDTVTLRTMYKITGRVQKMSVDIGQQKKVGTLTVSVEKCLKKPPEETPENAAFLTIVDDDTPDKPVFHGWMFSSNPALSAMEHPVYDIWVVECGHSAKSEPVVEAQPVSEQLDSNEPIED